ncbi:MAG TPA: hypothetical protein VM145_00305 [Sphingomicrobium sp.]|nr:hypothetical protein [Sphingomicrobium sp.]
MLVRSGLALLAVVALAGCGSEAPQGNQPAIKVTSAEQQRLHQLDAFNLAIGLKRAIYDAGYVCKRVTDAGFVGTYKNLDMWMAKCSEGTDWAVFAGPDGSAQVRDCRDVPGTGLPECAIKQRPKGSFNDAK